MIRFMRCIVLALGLLGVGTAAAQDAPLRVVATTTIVADVAQHIGGDYLTVTALVPVDSDAHAFEPSPQDVQQVADADLVLWDPERRHVLDDASVVDRTGYTPYAGRALRGVPHTVLRRGQVIVRDGALIAAPGSGRMIARQRPGL